MYTDRQIGEMMRKIRKEKGLATSEVLDQLQISQPTLSRIETGSQMIPVTLLSKFCEISQISIYEFFRLLDEELQIQNAVRIGEEKSSYAENGKDSIFDLVQSLTLEERKAVADLIRIFKDN